MKREAVYLDDEPAIPPEEIDLHAADFRIPFRLRQTGRTNQREHAFLRFGSGGALPTDEDLSQHTRAARSWVAVQQTHQGRVRGEVARECFVDRSIHVVNGQCRTTCPMCITPGPAVPLTSVPMAQRCARGVATCPGPV